MCDLGLTGLSLFGYKLPPTVTRISSVQSFSTCALLGRPRTGRRKEVGGSRSWIQPLPPPPPKEDPSHDMVLLPLPPQALRLHQEPPHRQRPPPAGPPRLHAP